MQLEAIVCPWKGDETDIDRLVGEAYALYGVNVGYRRERTPDECLIYFMVVFFPTAIDEERAYDVFFMVLELFDNPPNVSFLGNINYARSPFGFFVYK